MMTDKHPGKTASDNRLEATARLEQIPKDAHGWHPIETVPKDGTMLDLWCEGGGFATEDDDPYMTIGFNNLDNTGEDKWLTAGWCWMYDLFVEGNGTPLKWKHRPTPPQKEEHERIECR